MNQQKEFDTALSNLNPTEKEAYMKANPIVGVGGVKQSVVGSNYQPTSNVITTSDLNTNTNLVPLPEKAKVDYSTPTVTPPSGTSVDATTGLATFNQPKPIETKTKSRAEQILDSIGVDIATLETQPAVARQLQEEKQLAQKTEQATKDYNTYNLRKRELENKIRQMELDSSGKTTAGVQDEISAYTRRANAELADLAIQAQASQGLLDSARQTIKDTLEAQFKPIEDRIARRTQYAQLASNDLTESEKYRLDQLNKKDEVNQKEISTFATNLANTVFDNGAPVGVRTKIFNIAGDYASGKITKEQAQAKMMEAAEDYGTKPTTTTEKAPTIQKINGVDYQWNSTSNKWEPVQITTATATTPTLQTAQAKANVDELTSLTQNPYIRSAVGPTILGRFVGRGLDVLTGDRQNFISSVEQIRSNLNLEALIGAKSRGATFGALSDQELQVLASAATKIGTWAIKDENGNVTGYRANEKDFKKELDKINNFAKLDYIIKGGDPMDVNSQLQSDGSIWTKNSDGTLTRIK